MRVRIAIVLVVALLVGCTSGTRPLTGGSLAVLPITELPPPSADFAEGAPRLYRVGAFDRLEVDVFGIPELSRREIQADASGRISFPLAGTIEADGLTLEQIAAAITTRLGNRYLYNPQVTVNLKEAVSRTVTVDGQVREPGQYPVLGRMTLMRAIASARGVTEFARQSEVVVFRTVGDQNMAALYNLDSIRTGHYRDPEIFPGDVVMVGDSPARRLFRDILQASPLFVTPIVALLQPR